MGLAHMTRDGGQQAPEGQLPGRRGGTGRKGWYIFKVRPGLHAVPSCDEMWPSQDPQRCHRWAGPCLSYLTAQETSTPRTHVTFPQGSLQTRADVYCSPSQFHLTSGPGNCLPGLCLCPCPFAIRKRLEPAHLVPPGA